VPVENSLWEGECFVFDNRVSVDHDLDKGSYDQCHACRMPIKEDDKTHEHFTHGVSCHHCHDVTDEVQKKRYLERQKQIELSKQRGEEHIGGSVSAYADKHRKNKEAFKKSQKD